MLFTNQGAFVKRLIAAFITTIALIECAVVVTEARTRATLQIPSAENTVAANSTFAVSLPLVLSPIVPQPGAVTLPIEVLSATGTTASVVVRVPAQSKPIAKLWLQIHGLSRANKASVQINNGAWVPLNNTTAAIAEPGKRYGGIGGAFSTLKLTLDVPSGAVQPGSNTVRFRFNGTDGESIGFRVLNLNFLAADDEKVLPASTFAIDDPATWTAPRPTAADISAGEQLWRTATIKESSLPNAITLKAHCMDCHTQDGRDLKYFNYSNLSIIERAKFHGLTQVQGEQIASYIRSLHAPNPGRPWNPPYQPGSGTDTKSVSEWAAGAGIDNVLDKDSDTQPYLPGSGIDRNALVKGNHIEHVNLREIPIAFQLLDWNHWLPRVHPLDSMGSGFTSDPMYTRYQNLRKGLLGQRGMTKEAYIFQQMRADFDAWKQPFGGTGEASPLFMALGPASGQPWTEKQVREQYAAAVWSAVKQWEIMQEFDLEGYGKQFYGANGEARQWYSFRALFNISPHILGMLNTYPVSGDGDGKLTNDYFANAWYELQILLNPSSRNAINGGFHTIDWGYMSGLFGDLSRSSKSGEPMRATTFALKAMQEHDNGYGPDGTGEGDTTNAWWGWNLRDNLANMNRSLADNWSEQPNPKPLVQTTFQVWMEQNGRYDADQWAGLSFGKPNDTYSLTARDYVFDTTNNYDTNNAEQLRSSIKGLRERYQADEALLAGMADFGKLLWPNNDWNALKVASPMPIGQPTGLTASPGIEQVTLRWSPVEGATSYNVKRSRTPDGIFLPVGYFINGTSFTSGGLVAGQTYYYVVSANNGRYEGVNSDQISAVPAYGLVGHWQFNGAANGMVPDTSTTGNAGEIIGAPTQTPRAGGSALVFDGKKDFVGTEQSLHRWLGSSATLTAWIKTTGKGDNFGPNAPGIAGGTARGGPAQDQDSIWGMLDANGRIGAQFGWSGAAVVSTQPVNDGTWHHVAITRNAATGEVRVYVDGMLSNSGTSATGTMKRRFWSIGRIDGSQRYWPGALSEVRIYDQVLSDQEIQDIYNTGG